MQVLYTKLYVQVDGVNVCYTKVGQGPPVLLVHGLGASMATWMENVGPLSHQHTVYALDLPGHGGSEEPRTNYKLDSWTRFLQRFMNAAGLEHASLIGNSVGGLLTLSLAINQPTMVDRLVLVDAAGLGRNLYWFLRFASLPFVGSILQRHGVRSKDALVKSIFYQPSALREDLLDELFRVRNLMETKEAVLKAIRNGVNVFGLRRGIILLDSLQRVQAPVIVIWGQEDKIVPVSHAFNATRVAPHWKLHVFPECGHWPQMERAEQFNRIVLDFLAEGSKERVD